MSNEKSNIKQLVMLKQGYTDPQLYKYNGDTDKEWYVGFRFTCPVRQQRKPVQVRLGINFFKTAREREAEGRAVIKIVNECLDAGWNPFVCNIEDYMRTQQEEVPAPVDHPVLTTPEGIPIPTPDTPFIEALQLSFKIKFKDLKKKSRQNYETGLRYAVPAAQALRIDQLPLCKLKRVHIRMVLEQIGKHRQMAFDEKGKGQTWTPNAFNRYKSYLSAFFDTLEGYDAIEFNPCKKIDDKDPIEFGVHRHATDEELEIIKEELPKSHPELYLLTRFEYVTGMRPNEILQTKYEMVDWLNSQIKLSYLEGKTKIFRLVPIPGFLLDWIKERQGSQPGNNYLFGRGLKSGPRSLTMNSLSRRWASYVKEKLGINVSLYSFKGLGGDAKREAGVSYGAVQAGFGHVLGSSSTKVYLRKEGERMRKQIIASAPDL